MAALMDEDAPRAALLFGVTGSGKTQVYLQLIAHALEQGKSAIVLVPEIGLTPRACASSPPGSGMRSLCCTPRCLRASGTTASRRSRPDARASSSARAQRCSAPAKNLALSSSTRNRTRPTAGSSPPRYHARDVAKYRAAQSNALLVLGSATPSVETYYGAKQGKYPIFTLTERFLGAGLPEVIISDMRGLAREGRAGIIGPDLERELISTLDKGKQAILFLNRRGNSRVIGCGVRRLGARSARRARRR